MEWSDLEELVMELCGCVEWNCQSEHCYRTRFISRKGSHCCSAVRVTDLHFSAKRESCLDWFQIQNDLVLFLGFCFLIAIMIIDSEEE
jgi:hypothetical protein